MMTQKTYPSGETAVKDARRDVSARYRGSRRRTSSKLGYKTIDIMGVFFRAERSRPVGKSEFLVPMGSEMAGRLAFGMGA